MTNVMAVAGGTHIQILLRSTSEFLASANIFPQLGVSAGTPKPKKLKADSTTIVTAINRVACTIIVEATLGNKCLIIIFDGLQPMIPQLIYIHFLFRLGLYYVQYERRPPNLKQKLQLLMSINQRLSLQKLYLTQ